MFSNWKIVSVSRNKYAGDKIVSFGEWDGESYVDEFFCTGRCARHFGYACAIDGMTTHKYREAVAKQGNEK